MFAHSVTKICHEENFEHFKISFPSWSGLKACLRRLSGRLRIFFELARLEFGKIVTKNRASVNGAKPGNIENMATQHSQTKREMRPVLSYSI